MESRRHPRYPIALHCVVSQSRHDVVAWNAVVQNFCANGMLLVRHISAYRTFQQFCTERTSDLVHIRFSLPNENSSAHRYNLLGRIARFVEGGDGVGIQFENLLSQRLVSALINYQADRMKHQSAEEKKKLSRRPQFIEYCKDEDRILLAHRFYEMVKQQYLPVILSMLMRIEANYYALHDDSEQSRRLVDKLVANKTSIIRAFFNEVSDLAYKSLESYSDPNLHTMRLHESHLTSLRAVRFNARSEVEMYAVLRKISEKLSAITCWHDDAQYFLTPVRYFLMFEQVIGRAVGGLDEFESNMVADVFESVFFERMPKSYRLMAETIEKSIAQFSSSTQPMESVLNIHEHCESEGGEPKHHREDLSDRISGEDVFQSLPLPEISLEPMFPTALLNGRALTRSETNQNIRSTSLGEDACKEDGDLPLEDNSENDILDLDERSKKKNKRQTKNASVVDTKEELKEEVDCWGEKQSQQQFEAFQDSTYSSVIELGVKDKDEMDVDATSTIPKISPEELKDTKNSLLDNRENDGMHETDRQSARNDGSYRACSTGEDLSRFDSLGKYFLDRNVPVPEVETLEMSAAAGFMGFDRDSSLEDEKLKGIKPLNNLLERNKVLSGEDNKKYVFDALFNVTAVNTFAPKTNHQWLMFQSLELFDQESDDILSTYQYVRNMIAFLQKQLQLSYLFIDVRNVEQGTYSSAQLLTAMAKLLADEDDLVDSNICLYQQLQSLLRETYEGGKVIFIEQREAFEVFALLFRRIIEDQVFQESPWRFLVRKMHLLTMLMVIQEENFLQDKRLLRSLSESIYYLGKIAAFCHKDDATEANDITKKFTELFTLYLTQVAATPFLHFVELLSQTARQYMRNFHKNLSKQISLQENQQKRIYACLHLWKELRAIIADRQVPKPLLKLIHANWRAVLLKISLEEGRRSKRFRLHLQWLELLINLSEKRIKGRILNDPTFRKIKLHIEQAVGGEKELNTLFDWYFNKTIDVDVVGVSTEVFESLLGHRIMELVQSQRSLLKEKEEVKLIQSMPAYQVDVGDFILDQSEEGSVKMMVVAWVAFSKERFICVDKDGLNNKIYTSKTLLSQIENNALVILGDISLGVLERATKSVIGEVFSCLVKMSPYDLSSGIYTRSSFERYLSRVCSEVAVFEGQSAQMLLLSVDVKESASAPQRQDVYDFIAGSLIDSLNERWQGNLSLQDAEFFSGRVSLSSIAVLVTNAQVEKVGQFLQGWLKTKPCNECLYQEEMLHVSVSCGIVTIDDTCHQPTVIMKKAFTASRQAQELGEYQCIRSRKSIAAVENNVALLEAKADKHHMLKRYKASDYLHDVETIMDKSVVELHCQKIIPLKNENKFYEVLLAWKHEGEQEQITRSIAELVMVAQANHRAIHLDKWVLTQVFDQLVEACSKKVVRGVFLINLSSSSVVSEEFLDFVLTIFQKMPIPQKLIGFEIPQQAFAENFDQAYVFVNSLKRIGCQVLLDNFGASLSPLTHLEYLPVDLVKVDGYLTQQLINNSDDAVRSIHNLCRSMKKKTIASWVESQESFEALQSMGFDYAQGFHIEKPRPIKDAVFEAVLIEE